jgi:hypothetical protein
MRTHFLTRNGLPYDCSEVDGTEDTVPPVDLPLCILPDGRRIARASVGQVAAGLGMISPPQLDGAAVGDTTLEEAEDRRPDLSQD